MTRLNSFVAGWIAWSAASTTSSTIPRTVPSPLSQLSNTTALQRARSRIVLFLNPTRPSSSSPSHLLKSPSSARTYATSPRTSIWTDTRHPGSLKSLAGTLLSPPSTMVRSGIFRNDVLKSHDQSTFSSMNSANCNKLTRSYPTASTPPLFCRSPSTSPRLCADIWEHWQSRCMTLAWPTSARQLELRLRTILSG
ncbi:hypothetical protein BGX24_007883, partial [Mortierella sp. AD032]